MILENRPICGGESSGIEGEVWVKEYTRTNFTHVCLVCLELLIVIKKKIRFLFNIEVKMTLKILIE